MMFWQRKQPPIETPSLMPVAAPVSDALILICEKCGKKLSRTPDDNPSRTIQHQLAARIMLEKIKEEPK
jgi:hypothetical protein